MKFHREHNDAVGMPAIPPPVAVLLWAGVGGAIEYLLPTSFAAAGFAGAQMWLAGLVGAAGLLAVAGAFAGLRNVGASADPRKGVPALAGGGVYQYSRNPMYLGMMLVLISAGLWVDSMWIAASAAPAVVVLQRTIIAREEAYLAQRFPGEYAGYRGRVRRWL